MMIVLLRQTTPLDFPPLQSGTVYTVNYPSHKLKEKQKETFALGLPCGSTAFALISHQPSSFPSFFFFCLSAKHLRPAAHYALGLVCFQIGQKKISAWCGINVLLVHVYEHLSHFSFMLTNARQFSSKMFNQSF